MISAWKFDIPYTTHSCTLMHTHTHAVRLGRVRMCVCACVANDMRARRSSPGFARPWHWHANCVREYVQPERIYLLYIYIHVTCACVFVFVLRGVNLQNAQLFDCIQQKIRPTRPNSFWPVDLLLIGFGYGHISMHMCVHVPFIKTEWLGSALIGMYIPCTLERHPRMDIYEHMCVCVWSLIWDDDTFAYTHTHNTINDKLQLIEWLLAV